MPDLDLCLTQGIIDNIAKCDYYLEEKFKSEISNYLPDNSYFSVFHLNVRSLMPKLDDLQQYLVEITHKFSVIGISETWLKNDNEAFIHHLPGYSFVNNNRKTKNGGGVGMFYISSALKFRVRYDLNLQKDDILESIFLETCLEENEKIKIGTIYKPPNNNFNDFETELKTILHKIDKENKTCILMGDFNIDILKYGSNDYANRFLNQMYSSQFYPVINRPTRITTNSATIIDNIFINNIFVDCSSGILISDLSDHLPVFQILSNLKIPKPKMISYKKREGTKENIDKLRNAIQNISWEYLGNFNDVDDAYSNFQETFLSIYNTCIPEKNYSKKDSKTTVVTSLGSQKGSLNLLESKTNSTKEF